MSRIARGIVGTALLGMIGMQMISVAPADAAPSMVTVRGWSALYRAFTTASPGTTTKIVLGKNITAPTWKSLWIPTNLGVGGAKVLFDLNGHNLSITQSTCAGITVNVGASLEIKDSKGSGVLTAVGEEWCPGIGAADDARVADLNHSNMGTIIIDSGTVIATGGDGASGLGGSYYFAGGKITINGGNVFATGGSEAPGIGNGWDAEYATSGMKITINGGNVNAVGGSNASGIGWSALSRRTGSAIHVGGCANITAKGGVGGTGFENDITGAGAGIGGGAASMSNSSPTPVIAAPRLLIDGIPAPGAATTGASGSSFDTGLGRLDGAPGSPITYSGNAKYVIKATATTPGAGLLGGLFVLTCTQQI